MKHYKLPFNIYLERKYDEINADNFIRDWQDSRKNRKERILQIDNDLHIELGKFSTYDIQIDEIVDLALRYALNKREFRKISARVIEEKQKKD